jgi:hypothetical protein
MNRRGLVIIFFLFSLVVLLGVGSTLLTRSLHAERMDSLSATWNRALPLADAAVDASIWKLHIGDFTSVPSAPMADGTLWSEVTPTGVSLEFVITAHGLYGEMQRDLEVVTQLNPTSVFQFGLFGDEQVVISGDVVTDSYNSDVAPYDPNNPGENGDVSSNTPLIVNG